MTPEFWAIVAVGVGSLGLFLRLDVRIGHLDARIGRLDERMAFLGERMAKLEGSMDGFTKGAARAAVAPSPQQIVPKPRPRWRTRGISRATASTA